MDQNIPIDRSKWKKPKYSGHYDSHAIFYEGISCKCLKCSVSFVFSAIEQQHKFEAEGKYPGWLPSLCGECSNLWQRISKVADEYNETWIKGKSELRLDHKFLSAWLDALIEAESYRQKGYEQNIRMIKNLLQK